MLITFQSSKNQGKGCGTNQDHEDHGNHEESHHEKKIKNEPNNKYKLKSPEITALLLTTKSPIANVNLPRLINQESTLQAANPAIEITRLTSMLGLGSSSFKIFSIILIIISALSIFSGLAGNLENRMGDLSVLRAIGYSRNRIFKIITLEGMLITLNGIFIGIIMGLGGFILVTQIITPMSTSHASISFSLNFFLVIITVFFAGLIAAIFPAYHYSKISLANQLSSNT